MRNFLTRLLFCTGMLAFIPAAGLLAQETDGPGLREARRAARAGQVLVEAAQSEAEGLTACRFTVTNRSAVLLVSTFSVGDEGGDRLSIPGDAAEGIGSLQAPEGWRGEIIQINTPGGRAAQRFHALAWSAGDGRAISPGQSLTFSFKRAKSPLPCHALKWDVRLMRPYAAQVSPAPLALRLENLNIMPGGFAGDLIIRNGGSKAVTFDLGNRMPDSFILRLKSETRHYPMLADYRQLAQARQDNGGPPYQRLVTIDGQGSFRLPFSWMSYPLEAGDYDATVDYDKPAAGYIDFDEPEAVDAAWHGALRSNTMLVTVPEAPAQPAPLP